MYTDWTAVILLLPSRNRSCLRFWFRLSRLLPLLAFTGPLLISPPG